MEYKTLILLDWDDTLFPTSWIMRNNIDLTDEESVHKYIKFFSKLDILLYNLLSNLKKYGSVVIVTNAMLKWIKITSNVLPNTQKLFMNSIKILSARDIYQDQYPNNMQMWKKIVFKNLVKKYYTDSCLQNIISIGDAEYEFNALVDLYDVNSVINKKILKTIRLLKDPNYDFLLDQLKVLNKSIKKICEDKKHLDLIFNPI